MPPEQTHSGKSQVIELAQRIDHTRHLLEKVRTRRSFPYVYLIISLPSVAIVLALTIVSEGLIDLTAGITGAFFFSLLVTCTYLVLFQPNKEETIRQLSHQLTQLNRIKAQVEAGIKGEQEVAHHLRWLPSNFLVFHDLHLVSPRYGVQQFDHVVIGPPGVYHLETKNLSGVIQINDRGDWIQVKSTRQGELRQGMDNPQAQLERHQLVLADLVKRGMPGNQIPVYGLVVMAHPKAIIEGDTTRITVIRKDSLNDYLLNQKPNPRCTPKLIKQIGLLLIRSNQVTGDINHRDSDPGESVK